MAVTLTQLVARVQGLCRPVSAVSTADIQAALTAILPEVSRLSPQKKAASLTLADGAGDLSTLTGWVDGTSVVTAVEYPLDEVPRSVLHPAAWDVRYDYTLAVENYGTEAVRVYFSTDHVISGDTTTFSTVQGEAAAHLAAAMLLESLAARWGQAQAVAVAGDEYSGPSPVVIEGSASAFRERAGRLLSPPTIVIGFDAPGYDFTPDPF